MLNMRHIFRIMIDQNLSIPQHDLMSVNMSAWPPQNDFIRLLWNAIFVLLISKADNFAYFVCLVQFGGRLVVTNRAVRQEKKTNEELGRKMKTEQKVKGQVNVTGIKSASHSYWCRFKCPYGMIEQRPAVIQVDPKLATDTTWSIIQTKDQTCSNVRLRLFIRRRPVSVTDRQWGETAASWGDKTST